MSPGRDLDDPDPDQPDADDLDADGPGKGHAADLENLSGDGSGASQRVDKWLWFARFFKTRSLAAKLVAGGKVRVTRPGSQPERLSKASQTVRGGDVLTFPQANLVRVVKILSAGTRRGPAPEAQSLYEDLAPPEARTAQAGAEPEDGSNHHAAAAPRQGQGQGQGQRDKGAGRPTKRDRRTLDRFKDGAG